MSAVLGLDRRWGLRSRRHSLLLLISVLLTFIIYLLYCHCLEEQGEVLRTTDLVNNHVLPPEKNRKTLVLASVKGDDVSWLDEVPDWNSTVYVVNDPAADYTVPKNKGREGMVYLTYIIDHYYDLPDFMVFLHSLRYQWHNDDPMYDGLPLVRNLHLNHVYAQGYVNMRCVWTLGCPVELRPNIPHTPEELAQPNQRLLTEMAYAEAWKEIFPGRPIPDEIGASCCAQFALSKERVLQRPRADYVRIRDWLFKTPLDDQISGRVLEYMWHIIFGESAVYCPNVQKCYCNAFGYCNLTCTEDHCEKRYHLPKYSQFPEGWPLQGGGQNGWPEINWHMKPDKGIIPQAGAVDWSRFQKVD